MKTHLWKLASLALIAVMLAGCGATVVPTAVPPTAAPATAIPPTSVPPTVVPAAGPLVVWDQFARDAEKAVLDGLNTQFEADHPGVKIDRVVKSYDDLKVTIKLALSDPNGPDIGQVNQGADMGGAVQGNLLVDLTPYTSKYGWDKTFSGGLLARNSWTADGKSFGTGNLYGVSPTAEVVGVFYNKTKFDKLGVAVPKTLADFETILAKAKQAGEIPLYFGNLDGWTGIHLWSAIEHVLLPDRTWLDNFVYGRNNVSFDISENVQASAKLQEWVKAGYLTDGFAAIGYDDSWKQFGAGQGVMFITGSWISGDLVTAGGENFGFFLMPPVQAGGKALAVGGIGLPFCIRNGAKNPELAAEYLDWMVSPQAAEAWLAKGILPAMPVDASKIPAGTLLGDIVTTFGAINQADGVGHYLDWAGPTMYDTLNAAIQELMALKITPEEFTAKVQAAYAKK